MLFFRDRFGVADQQRAGRSAQGVELRRCADWSADPSSESIQVDTQNPQRRSSYLLKSPEAGEGPFWESPSTRINLRNPLMAACAR
jgi:hypothetical protein